MSKRTSARRDLAAPVVHVASGRDLPDPHTPGMNAPADCGVVFLHRPAPPSLRPFYTELATYEETGGFTIRQIETASLAIPLIISFGTPFRIRLGQTPIAGDEQPSFIAGLDTARIFIASSGRAACLQVNLTPVGAQRLLGIPASEFAGRMVPLADLAHPQISELRRRLEDTDDWNARLDCAEGFLAAGFGAAAAEPSHPLVDIAFGLIASGGVHRIDDLAARIGWSRKHLADRFSRAFGLSPKTVARIARFNRAQALARAAKRPDWADIASAGGYSDQAHMIREFEEFAGLSPRAWWLSLDKLGSATWQDPPGR
ncbi:helix-turn-helix domain-containing protein [Stappia sp. WLB 29]|uniref:helix-turn-helix domain-containing protein n=1 Tax=Stappia sp. WLB 29 TaxID=2925220 RepID=UPI0020BEF099|nr:helix-turn-helix domain-containing protein [Stappia sp. WLB 29]